MKIPFHIQHNTTPELLGLVLEKCHDGHSSTEDLARGLAVSVGTVQHVIPFVRQIGLLKEDKFSLTDEGRAYYHLARLSPTTLAEAMHHLLYTLHHFDSAKRFSWAYARVVDALWTTSERSLDSETMAELVWMVVEDATRTFDVTVEQIAFSRNSVRGVLNWLQALDPPTVTKEGKRLTFRRRFFCPVLTFLWTVDFLYRVSNAAYGVRMFLTAERIEALCRVCVLDPSGLENVLELAKRTSDFDRGGIFDYGTEGGFGRWILLARPCGVPSLPGGGQ